LHNKYTSYNKEGMWPPPERDTAYLAET
jgi:hypothetical protein